MKFLTIKRDMAVRSDVIVVVVVTVVADDLSPCDENPACCRVFLRNSSKSLMSVSGSHGILAEVVAGGLPVVGSVSNLTASWSSESPPAPKKLSCHIKAVLAH